MSTSPYRIENSFRSAKAVTLSDSTVVAFDGLYVGVSGDVKITDMNGVATVFKAAPVGFLNVACTLVWSTGTTATNIVGLNR